MNGLVLQKKRIKKALKLKIDNSWYKNEKKVPLEYHCASKQV